MIQGLDRRLIEKTVELANKTKVLVPGSYVPHLIPALVGSIKVEDTYNLLGHARKAISVIARQQGRAGGGSR